MDLKACEGALLLAPCLGYRSRNVTLYRKLVKPRCKRKRSSVSRSKGASRKAKQSVLLLLSAGMKAGVASWLCSQMVHVSHPGR